MEDDVVTRQWRRRASRDRGDFQPPGARSDVRQALLDAARLVWSTVARRAISISERCVAPAAAGILLITIVGLVVSCLQQASDGQQLASDAGPIQPSPAVAPSATPAQAPPTVFIDPGHGGVDLGTVGINDDGSYVFEKNVALALALRTADHLRAAGINVVLSRTDDSLPGTVPSDYTADGEMLTDAGLNAELQSRVERANASGAQLLLSIHFNGLDDPSAAGTTTVYCGSRSFAEKNRRFATLIQDTVIAALRAEGFTTPDLGVIDDEVLLGTRRHLALLGPAVPDKPHSSDMPGALFETFYLTNPLEASAITQPDTQDLIAAALAKAIEQYLRGEGYQISPPATAEPR